MRIKRLLMIGGYPYSPGSAATNFVLTFVKGYAQLGLDVRLYFEVRPGVMPPAIDGVRIYTSPVVGIREILRKFNYFQAYSNVAKFIKDNYIDGETVIQQYNSPQYGWIFRPKYPTFHTIGEVPFAHPRASISYRFREWGSKYSNKMATGLLVQTSYLKEYFAEYGIKNIQVFNILIDPARFDNLRSLTDNNYISYCGRVGLYKDGVHDLIEAFRIVHKRHSDIKLRIIGGFYSDKDEEQLRTKVKDLELEEYVVFTGLVTPEIMPSLLYNSRILALARPDNIQAKYGFPSKLGEYLFTGRPVVVTRVGELDHFLKDYESCVFASPNNHQDFAEKLNWVLDHPTDAEQIGKNGYKVALDNFSMQSQCKVALNFFERVLSNS